MHARTKNILLLIILLVISLPLLQEYVLHIPEKPLEGVFADEERPVLTYSSWMDEQFQAISEIWVKARTGFHPSLIRLNNQMNYTLFHKPRSQGVTRGKGGQLYEYDYIRAWMGKDYVGEEFFDRRLHKFSFLQKYLKDSLDIDLVLVLEPGKASVYPEDIPDRFRKEYTGKSNYSYICQKSDELGIQHIDFNRYFIDIKDTSPYPVLPPQGTHWSEFMALKVADSLLRYIEFLRGIEIPDIIIDSVVTSHELKGTDDDISKSMNLMFTLEHPPMPYPVYHFEKIPGSVKPKVLTLADSYYWNIYHSRIPDSLYAENAFWYFYEHVFHDSIEDKGKVWEVNVRKAVEAQDVIFLMMTERFCFKFDRGFVDDLYSFYGMPSDIDRIDRYMTSIVRDDEWFDRLLEEAERTGESPGKRMEREAYFLLRQDDPEAYYSLQGWAPIIDEITNDEAWLAGVQQRAKESGQSLEERLQIEAEYTLNQRYPRALERYKTNLVVKESTSSDNSK